jgi:VacB/RNase II family 3'-5' exoribonuclease
MDYSTDQVRSTKYQGLQYATFMSNARAMLRAIARRAMVERGFEPDFPSAVVAQVEHLTEAAAASPARRDLRRLLWCSIDNDDSRDLDQLSVAEPRGADVAVLVAIADVDAMVTCDSPVDRHAQTNTTSVYTPAEIFAMLPERLSTDLTSLAEGEDRPAVVTEMVVSPDGVVRESDVFLALVRNHAKLAYPSVGAWLEADEAPPPRLAAVPGLADNLRQQDAAARALKASRHRRGALSLDTVEGRPVFDGDAVRDVTAVRRTRAAELIEDFMIAVNSCTAQLLESRGFASLRRIVRMPDRWPRIVTLAADTGTELPAAPDARALEAWLLKQRDEHPGEFADLSLSVVKLLGRGEYVVEQPNEPTPDHFGLAVDDYTHATAPNRRFADLVTQRLVKAALAQQRSPYSDAALAAIATHCMEREDAANRVERQVKKAAAAMVLQPRVGQVFDAVVTGASPKGTWVRLARPIVEGRLDNRGNRWQVGDKVRVRLSRVDPERGFIDFESARRT